ncbi:hypothetical protein BH10PSE18_BH10PSE18_35380 [soil metagenome]
MSARLSPAPLLSAFQESYTDVVRFIARRTGSAQDARELAHDTWIRLAERGADDEAPPPAARAYVYTVAENIAIDHLRRRQRGAERFTPQRTDDEAPLREPLTPDIAERLGHRQALDAVAEAIAQLPARSRDIFLADRLDGASHAELAVQHGVSIKTVEREVMRAMDGVEAALHRWRGEAVPARAGRRRALSALLGVTGMGVGSAGLWQAWRQYVPTDALTLATAPGRIRQQTLSDGSRLTLDAASRLEVAYYAARRTTRLLAGSVFFDVARDPERPFTVAAGAHEVTVLGTRFEVALHEETGGLQVAVESGRVHVRSGAGARCELGAGERMRIEGTQLTVSRDGDTAAVAPWREGWLDFQHTPLGEVVERLARYGTRPIHVAPEAAQLPVVGRVRIAYSLAWLRLLPGSLPVQIREQGPERSLVIERRG